MFALFIVLCDNFVILVSVVCEVRVFHRFIRVGTTYVRIQKIGWDIIFELDYSVGQILSSSSHGHFLTSNFKTIQYINTSC